MAKIKNVSAEVKSAIQRKSAYSLPNNPTDSGFKASDIRNAFYKPIIDITNSALTEIDRIVNEANKVLGAVTGGVDAIENVAGIYYHGTDGLIYTFNNEAFSVSGNDELVGSIVIPDSVFHEGMYYPVEAISASAFEGSGITAIEIPSSVETIGDRAFYSCSQLTKAKLHGSTSIGTSAFTSGKVAFSVPKEYLTAYESSLASYKKSLVGFDTVTHNQAQIAELITSKLNKVTSQSALTRLYAISPTGAQSTKSINETPTQGDIPVFLTGGRLPVGTPSADNNATPKGYVEDRLAKMGAYISFTVDPLTYKMTLQLKNEANQVLSQGVVDLPMESVIVGASYANGVLTLQIVTGEAINIDISDLIDGLVSQSTFNSEIARIDGNVRQNTLHQTALELELQQKEYFNQNAYYAEEAETARGYTKGGRIDLKFRNIEASDATDIALSLDDDYKLTVSLLNKAGAVVSSGMVDLPIESLITKASYSNKILTLTFQSGDKLNIDISSIVSGLVPETRKVNGKALSSDITLTASDVGAYGKTETYTKTETSNLLENQKQLLLVNIEEHQVVGYACLSDEAEKARGYVKGGAIDKELKKLSERVSTLEGN